MAKERLILGLHCGPAGDGVDACLLAVTGRGLRLKARQAAWAARPLPLELSAGLREALAGADEPARSGQAPTEAAARLAELEDPLAEEFARAAGDLLAGRKTAPAEVSAAAMTGLLVGRGPWMSEWPRPERLRQRLAVPLVAGFARSDQAAGGPGVHPVQTAERILLGQGRLSRVVLHLGGLTGLTFLPSHALPDEVQAFDVGPGTLVLDALARRHFQRAMDADGRLAAQGRACAELLVQLQAHPRLAAAPGPARRRAANDWLGQNLERLELQAERAGCGGADLLATVTEWIARTAAGAVLGLTERPHEVVLTGGGAHNIHLAGRIRSLLSPSSTYAAPRYGLEVQAWQAAMAALLAALRLDSVPAHHIPLRGAGPVLLGGLW